jgi:hypothetical protein
MIYLYPFGASSIENIEGFDVNQSNDRDPIVFCYDQEPLIPGFNDELFQYIRYKFLNRPIILLNTEQDSEAKEYFLTKYRMTDAYCFFHIFAAHDWFRGYRYDANIIPVAKRQLRKAYISFNRLTGSARVYRSMLIAEFARANLLVHGHVSYSHICPDHGHYYNNLPEAYGRYGVSHEYIQSTIDTLDTLPHPLRIDHQEEDAIPNHSMVLSAVPECMESFIYVVTETCFWEKKKHLTEKIFKPVILRMPFVLVGCAYNLAYLKSYGFKTFDRWIDESYDYIENPIERLQAVVKVLEYLASLNLADLTDMLHEMEPVLEHNYNLFNSQEFLDSAWTELKTNLTVAVNSVPT